MNKTHITHTKEVYFRNFISVVTNITDDGKLLLYKGKFFPTNNNNNKKERSSPV